MHNKIKTVAIAGAGTMGVSIAVTFAKFGYEVILMDVSIKTIEKATDSISQREQQSVVKKIYYTTETAMLAKSDLLIEAIVEDLDLKQKFWNEVSEIVSDSAILVSNTSGLSITKIAEAVKMPERFAGMHWINPADIIPLIEIIRGKDTNDKTIGIITDICKAVGKKPIAVKDAPGFVLNRIQLAVLRECLHIVEKGIATVEDVDNVVKYALGIRYACIGPFEVVDHGGIDIFHNIANYLFADLSTEAESFFLLKENFEKGNLGVKTQKGFYNYTCDKDKEAIQKRDQMYKKIVDAIKTTEVTCD